MKIISVFALLAASAMHAQIVPPGSGGTAKVVGPRGDTLPSTCVDGQLYQKTGATNPGTYGCTNNAWIGIGPASTVYTPHYQVSNLAITGRTPTTITHNLGTLDVECVLRDHTTKERTTVACTAATINTVIVTTVVDQTFDGLIR